MRRSFAPRLFVSLLLALLLAAMSFAASAAESPDGEASGDGSSSQSASSESAWRREPDPSRSSSSRESSGEESGEATEAPTEPATEAPAEPVVVIRTVEVEAVTEAVSRAVMTREGPVAVEGVSHMAEAGAAAAFVNAAREEAGLPPLAYDGFLTEAAVLRSLELSLAFGHERPDGSAWHTVSEGVASELTARGYQSGAAVAEAWLASPGHRAALLDGACTRIGISGVETGGEFYWALTLGA